MSMPLVDGSRIGIIGGGPSGSLFAYFLLSFARRLDMDLQVDIYEPRSFTEPGPGGCNMCGGIVSESLVQLLAVEGIFLPTTVVQRAIDSYVLHTDTGSVKIHTPLDEKRIAAVHRGGGPRNFRGGEWGGLDGYLLTLAEKLGARVVKSSASEAGWNNGRPQVRSPGTARSYDLFVGATGVNSGSWRLFEELGLPSRRPEISRTYVAEIKMGRDAITRRFGSSLHIFFLQSGGLDFAVIIPKGDFLTVCLLGPHIDRKLIEAFFQSAPVQRCLSPTPNPTGEDCHCSPRLSLREASRPFMDRVVLVGDCGTTRLYKDGIGAVYRTAKAAARTAVFSGVSAEDFKKHYWPTYRSIAVDNRFGRLLFNTARRIRRSGTLLRAVLKIAEQEQARPDDSRRLSGVLWDLFTGSASYREIFFRTLDLRLLGRFIGASLPTGKHGEARGTEHG